MARAVLDGVMGWAALGKLANPQVFERVVGSYEVLPGLEVAAGACPAGGASPSSMRCCAIVLPMVSISTRRARLLLDAAQRGGELGLALGLAEGLFYHSKNKSK